MDVIISIILIIMVSLAVTRVIRYTGISSSVALILVGILFSAETMHTAFIASHETLFRALGEIGLVFLMFMAGLEISWCTLYDERRDSLFIAIFAAIVPLLIGTGVLLLLGFSAIVALTVGICISITAEATKARELLEVGALKSKVGTLLMGAGILDDVIGIALFSSVLFMITKSFHLQEFVMFTIAIAAFFTGIILHHFLGREHTAIAIVEKTATVLIVPFFFIAMGTHFTFVSLALNIPLVIVIIGLAILGKLVGIIFTKPFIPDLTQRQFFLIGWGMNSRGAVELVIAYIAFSFGLIPTSIYSALIMMAFVTTLLFPFIMKRIIKSDPAIMDE